MVVGPSKIPTRRRRRGMLTSRWWSRGAISWGADLSGMSPVVLNLNADAACATGVWTTCLESQSGGTAVPIAQRTNNDFIPIISGVLDVIATAGTLTALEIAYALVAGTPITTAALDFAQVNKTFAAAVHAYVPFVLAGPLSQSAYAGAGANPLIQLMPTGDTVTVAHLFSYALFRLELGVE